MSDVFSPTLPPMKDDSAPDVSDGTPLSADELDAKRFQALAANDRYLKKQYHFEASDPTTAPADVSLVWRPASNRTAGGNMGWVRIGVRWYPFGIISLDPI